MSVWSEVGSSHAARRRILHYSVAAAVSLAERRGAAIALQLLCSDLLCHCRHHQLCRLLLQRPRYQPAAVGPYQMVDTASSHCSHLLQQSDRRGLGYNHCAGCDGVCHPATVLHARSSVVYHKILVHVKWWTVVIYMYHSLVCVISQQC